jgi:hypothetical protein
MKSLLVLVLALSGSAYANAAPLVKATRQPGYELHPVRRVFTLDSSGRMTLDVQDFRENRHRVIALGTLSRYSLGRIALAIQSLPDGAKLVDDKEGQPRCADAPSYSTSVMKGGHEVEIYRSAECHEWHLDSYAAEPAKALAAAFLDL